MFNRLTLVMDGIPYGPVKVEGTDANQALPASIVTNSLRNALRVVVSCEDNPIRYAFGGVVPTQAGLGHVLYPGSTLVIGHPSGIASFRFINFTNAANANVQITGEYGA